MCGSPASAPPRRAPLGTAWSGSRAVAVRTDSGPSNHRRLSRRRRRRARAAYSPRACSTRGPGAAGSPRGRRTQNGLKMFDGQRERAPRGQVTTAAAAAAAAPGRVLSLWDRRRRARRPRRTQSSRMD